MDSVRVVVFIVSGAYIPLPFMVRVGGLVGVGPKRFGEDATYIL